MKTLAPEAEARSQTAEGCANSDLGVCKIQEWGSQGDKGRSYAKLLGESQTPKETRKSRQGACTHRTLQRGVMSTWTPCKWAWNPGTVGRGGKGEPCRERVGGPPQQPGPGPGPGGRAGRRPKAPCQGHWPSERGSSPPVPSTLSSAKFSTLTFSSCPVRLAAGTGGRMSPAGR